MVLGHNIRHLYSTHNFALLPKYTKNLSLNKTRPTGAESDRSFFAIANCFRD